MGWLHSSALSSELPPSTRSLLWGEEPPGGDPLSGDELPGSVDGLSGEELPALLVPVFMSTVGDVAGAAGHQKR